MATKEVDIDAAASLARTVQDRGRKATSGPWTSQNGGIYSEAPRFAAYGGNVATIDESEDVDHRANEEFITRMRVDAPLLADAVIAMAAELRRRRAAEAPPRRKGGQRQS